MVISAGWKARPFCTTNRSAAWAQPAHARPRSRYRFNRPSSVDVHQQLHLGMDVTMHFTGARTRERLGQLLARLPFVRVELAVSVHLVDEFVIIGEGHGIARLDGDF